VSIKLVKAVFQIQEIGMRNKFILVALAFHSDDKGLCCPSVKEIQSMTSLGRVSVFKYLRELVELNLITKISRFTGGSQETNIYWVHLGKNTEEVPCLDKYLIIPEDSEHYSYTPVGKTTLLQKKRNAFQKKKKKFYTLMLARGDEEVCVVAGCTNPDLTIDHIIALFNGGENVLSNFQFMCKSHNCSKGIKCL